MDHVAGTVALTVDHAPPHELMRIVLESYGLTARETEVALLLGRGLAAKNIAAELTISAHTVRERSGPRTEG